MQGQPRPCKFGADCRNFAKGTCTFYHPPGQVPNPNPPYQPGGGQPPYNPFGHNKPKPGGGSYPHPQPGSGYQKPGVYNPTHPKPKQNDKDIEFQLCKMFHLDLPCKFGDKCNKKHHFLLSQPQGIRRFIMMRNLPLHPVSKLTKFISGGKDYYVMRNNLDITVFEFNIQLKAFKDVYNWQLPDPNGNFTYYDQRNEYVYFARQNPDMHYQDIGFYSLQSQKTFIVQNAHTDKLTGIVHFNQDIVLSTSINGQLKVWQVSGQKLQTRNQFTQKLRSLYNPQNAKIELYFIDISMVNGMKITSIGTSDGRIIFFIGEEMNYQHVSLSQQYVTQILY